MSANKQTVEKDMDAFSKSDHEQVLSCLADDVEWEIPGAFHVTGKAALTRRSRTLHSRAGQGYLPRG